MFSIFRIPIHAYKKQEAAKKFVDFCNGSKQQYATTPNAEILLLSKKNTQLKKILQASPLNIPDSVSLLWASMYVGGKWSKKQALFELLLLPIHKKKWTHFLPEQICGSDFIYSICEEAAKQKKSLFFLGGIDNVAKKSAKILSQQSPNLKIAGAYNGNPYTNGDKESITQIQKSKADILIICYGCPLQELWIHNNLHQCPDIKAAIGLGGTFDFISGKIPRSPKILRHLGLEWLWRLFIQPSRFKRIFQAVVVFPYMILFSHKDKK